MYCIKAQRVQLWDEQGCKTYHAFQKSILAQLGKVGLLWDCSEYQKS